MAIVNKPNIEIIWAESGNTLEPSTEKQEIGWVVEKPSNEMFNWVLQQHDLRSKYLFQRGASVEWDSVEEYPVNARIDYNGTLYQAKLQNTNKQPDLNPEVWKIPFASYTLEYDLDQVLNTINYADNLVYKDDPILRATAKGTAYLANTGTSLDSGYAFNNFETSGLFHNGTSPAILKNGIEVAVFEPVVDRNESNKKVVTMDILQEYLQQYKVGDLYLTTNTGNPSTILGYGTWTRFGEGRALVGYSSDTSSSTPDWVKMVNREFGSYTHQLTSAENGRHDHFMTASSTNSADGGSTYMDRVKVGTDEGYSLMGTEKIPDTYITGSSGLGQPHNNVQPSIVVFVWKRVG